MSNGFREGRYGCDYNGADRIEEWKTRIAADQRMPLGKEALLAKKQTIQNQDGWVEETMTKYQETTFENLRPSRFISHFRLLGLRRGECRTQVIRSAAQAMSVALSHHENHSQGELADRRRARIAFAAYRLLDPRERRDLYERVQLSYPIDREAIQETNLSGQANYLVPSKIEPEQFKQQPIVRASEKPSTVLLMKQPLIDQAFDGSDDESLVEAEIVSQQDDQESQLNERRGIVRLIRELDRLEPRTQSTLDWIRSRLGI